MNDMLIKILPELLSPALVAVVMFWMKSQIKKVDQISQLLVEVHSLKDKMSSVLADLEKVQKQREDFIILKSEVKTQWVRLDELKERVKEAGM